MKAAKEKAPESDEMAHVEMTILGAIMVEPEALFEAEEVRADDFALHSHQIIYRAMLDVGERGHPVDIITVTNHLVSNKTIDAVGGRAYLAYLTERVPRKLNIESYVKIVRAKSLLRQTRNICELGSLRAQEGVEDPRLLITDIEGQLAKARAEIQDGVTLITQGERALEMIREERSGKRKKFLPTGIGSIDFTHGGYAVKEVMVIGARPRIGKSTILRMGVMENCLKGNYVHLFSPEMPAEDVMTVWASFLAKVPYRKIRHAERLLDDEMASVEAAMRDIMQWPLTLDSSSPLTPEMLISRARTIKRKKGTKLLGLDYLQKMKFSGKSEQRHISVGDAMVDLTSFAKAQDVAVVVVSSITEPSGKERNKPPTLADLRQSGDIQFEANAVILLHREINDKEKVVPETSIIFGKVRSEEDGVKTVYFDSNYIRFQEEQAYLMEQGKW